MCGVVDNLSMFPTAASLSLADGKAERRAEGRGRLKAGHRVGNLIWDTIEQTYDARWYAENVYTT